ncbi:MAG: hypothetical protein DMF70_04930 [Acidobacteria bacterium]|nr:MAG: hypothetical protein DMF70_04930 [Acidobacteriota bacterium]
MKRLSLPFLAAFCLLAIPYTIDAQPASKTQSVNQPVASAKEAAADKTAREAEAARLLAERRTQARSLLLSLAADVRNFSDQTLRARTQARIADALWDADPERARALFRSAWDAAELADREGQARLQEDIRQAKAKTGGGYAVTTPPDLRREVLRLAAKHDRALGEELLGKFKTQKEQEAADAKNRNPFSTDEAVGQRLGLARQLLEAGDTERALQFADPVLGGINMESIDFLSYLREKNSTAADQRYAVMLANAAANPQSDANTVSLLSSYLFTPHLYITFSGPGGTGTSQTSSRIAPPDVTPALREAYLRTAAGILLRPLAPPGQDQTTSGPDGQYLIIKRLMPLFEQFGTPEMTAALRDQLQVLGSIVRDGTRQRDDDPMRNGIRPDQPAADREQSLLNQIDHAKTSAEQDRIYLQLAMFMAGKGDLRARDYVAKIEESEMRNNARAFVDATMAAQAVDKKDTERALEIARTGELTHLQKAWLLTQTAKLLAKSDHEKALTLIEDAATEARRIDGSDPDRPRAFFAVTNALLVVNRATAWDVMGDAIKAANSAENFTGEDGELTFQMLTKGMSSVRQNSVADFDVTGIFEALAKEDYEKAVDLARGLQRDAPRASAVLAIARSVLSDKQK